MLREVDDKMNLLTKTTALAMELTLKYVIPGDVVIDATSGNGHDTLTLAEAVGDLGQVIALDIQQSALESAGVLLHANAKENVTFVQGNFRNLAELTTCLLHDRKPSAIVFNLGYLPGGDKSVTTVREDSVEAVKQALELVAVDGVVTVVLYCGHEAGKAEKKAVLDMAAELPASRFHAVYGGMINQRKDPPEVLWITKKK